MIAAISFHVNYKAVREKNLHVIILIDMLINKKTKIIIRKPGKKETRESKINYKEDRKAGKN